YGVESRNSKDSNPELFPPPVSPKSNTPTSDSDAGHSLGTETFLENQASKSRPSQRSPICTSFVSADVSSGGYDPMSPASSVNCRPANSIRSRYRYANKSFILA